MPFISHRWDEAQAFNQEFTKCLQNKYSKYHEIKYTDLKDTIYFSSNSSLQEAFLPSLWSASRWQKPSFYSTVISFKFTVYWLDLYVVYKMIPIALSLLGLSS